MPNALCSAGPPAVPGTSLAGPGHPPPPYLPRKLWRAQDAARRLTARPSAP